MKTHTTWFCLVIVLLMTGSPSLAYDLFGSSWTSHHMDYLINGNGAPGGINSVLIFNGAATEWNDTPASFNFNYIGTTSLHESFMDNTNIMYWSSIDGMYGTLAQTIFYYWGSDILDADIRFDVAERWWNGIGTCPLNYFDLRSTCLHEMGHALGLNHEDPIPPNCPAMRPYMASCEIFHICTDDENGVLAIYGISMPAMSTVGLIVCLAIFGSLLIWKRR